MSLCDFVWQGQRACVAEHDVCPPTTLEDPAYVARLESYLRPWDKPDPDVDLEDVLAAQQAVKDAQDVLYFAVQAARKRGVRWQDLGIAVEEAPGRMATRYCRSNHFRHLWGNKPENRIPE